MIYLFKEHKWFLFSTLKNNPSDRHAHMVLICIQERGNTSKIDHDKR